MEIRLHVQDAAEVALSIGSEADMGLNVGAEVIDGGITIKSKTGTFTGNGTRTDHEQPHIYVHVSEVD